jgi:rhamnose utilization protein RhaD (predicted bifunctional aldolase and dehydrogenase)
VTAIPDRSGLPDPDLTELVRLSRTLGEPWRRFAILAEGNTSQRVGDDVLAVKVTGRSLRDAGADDFVLVGLQRLSELIDDPAAGDADVAAYFDEVEAEQGGRPSVEALLHVVCVLDCGATTAAHTHPESVNALLCTDKATVLAEQPLFPDQVVVVGRRALLVPYTDPGVVLAREVRHRLAAYVPDHGLPRAIYLGNHGMFALGAGAAQALQITEMADKTARVLATALSLGTVVPMAEESAVRIDTRDDEQVRRAALARASLRPRTGTRRGES